jgi:hypothetical protein
MPKRLLVMAVSIALFVGWTPTADAAFLSKRQARSFLLRAVPPSAPRVLLRDRRSAFFRTARVRVAPARRCRRHGAAAVSCRFRARLVPDAAHRRRNWWPIHCRGAVLVRRRANGRLQGVQRNYVCRTVRP